MGQLVRNGFHESLLIGTIAAETVLFVLRSLAGVANEGPSGGAWEIACAMCGKVAGRTADELAI